MWALANKCLDENFEDYKYWWFAFSIALAPFALIVALIMYPSFFFRWMIPKKKPREKVPWTCGGYLWWEVVMVRGNKAIVIDYSWSNRIHILWVNSSTSEWVNTEEITSTTKPSELAEELSMLDQANKLLAKADAIVKEAGEIKMKAVKKRTNLIYLPK